MVYNPEADMGKHKLDMVPMELLKRSSQHVLKKLPRLVMPNGVKLPRFIDRIDMGFNDDGRIRPFVNEIEYCPSYFIQSVPVETGAKLIKSIGHQIVKIARLYRKRSASRLSASRHKSTPSQFLTRKREAAPSQFLTRKRKRAD